MWHAAREQDRLVEDWDLETHPLWPSDFGGATWETGSGSKAHAEPYPPEGVQRTQTHQAALARALGVRPESRPERDTPPHYLLKYS
jgi:hypothetical protein